MVEFPWLVESDTQSLTNLQHYRRRFEKPFSLSRSGGLLIGDKRFGSLEPLFGPFATLAAVLSSFGEVSPTTNADHLPLVLVWKAPESCPSATSERAEIGRRVGDIEKTPPMETILARVEIRALSNNSFQLLLNTDIGGVVGERELSGSDCRQLAEATALVLALLINPNAMTTPETAPAEPKTSAPVAPPLAESASVEPARPNPRFGAGLDAVIGQGVLPGLAQGLDLRAIFQRGHWAALAGAGGFLPNREDAQILPGAKASFYRLEWTLAACAQTLPARRLGAAVCLGGALVRLHGASSGVSNPGNASALWLEGLSELSAHLRVTGWARVRLSVEGRALGRAPDFAILGLGSVYRPPATSVRGGLGFDVLF